MPKTYRSYKSSLFVTFGHVCSVLSAFLNVILLWRLLLLKTLQKAVTEMSYLKLFHFAEICWQMSVFRRLKWQNKGFLWLFLCFSGLSLAVGVKLNAVLHCVCVLLSLLGAVRNGFNHTLIISRWKFLLACLTTDLHGYVSSCRKTKVCHSSGICSLLPKEQACNRRAGASDSVLP